MIKDLKTEEIISGLLSGYEFPRMVRVRQKFDDSHIVDIQKSVRDEFGRTQISAQLDKIKPGDSVAITAGSRQIANACTLLKCIIGELKARKAEPFIVPAMGSHGGATAEGQRELLESLGISEESMGIPILSCMETVYIGDTEDGHPVYIDKTAYKADHIVVFHRIKIHPCFHGPFESGLMKMMTIGLGKQYGAQTCHNEGFGVMSRNVEYFGKTILKNVPILLGVAVIENAYDQTYSVKALTPEEIPVEEPKLLELSRQKMGKLQFASCDVLVVDWMGKNISGSGMDCNITGRYTTEFASGGIKAQKLVVLDLTEESHGNCVGIGVSDVTTQKLMDKSCVQYAYVNALTSLVSTGCKLPMTVKNDKEAISAGIRLCVGVDRKKIRLIRIKDTLHIGEIEVSEAMLDEVRKNPALEIISEPYSWEFDENGNITEKTH